MSKRSGSKPLLTLMAVGALGVGALAYYVKSTPQAAHVPPELHRPTEESPIAPLTKKTSSSETPSESVKLPEVAGDDVVMVGAKHSVPAGQDPKTFVANEILKTLKYDGVQVSKVTMNGSQAVVELSGDLSSGSMSEGQLLKALQLGFGQFSDVETLSFTKAGQALETLGGHVEVVDPTPVIRASASAPVAP